jgi:hypothetical protein
MNLSYVCISRTVSIWNFSGYANYMLCVSLCNTELCLIYLGAYTSTMCMYAYMWIIHMIHTDQTYASNIYVMYTRTRHTRSYVQIRHARLYIKIRDTCAYETIVRIWSDYEHMKRLCAYETIVRIWNDCAHMKPLCAYETIVHIWNHYYHMKLLFKLRHSLNDPATDV